MSWLDRALCAKLGLPIDHFFDDYLKDKEVFRKVNDTCRNCSVRKECLRYGRRTKSIGVWGGHWLQYGSIVNVIDIDDEEKGD